MYMNSILIATDKQHPDWSSYECSYQCRRTYRKLYNAKGQTTSFQKTSVDLFFILRFAGVFLLLVTADFLNEFIFRS